ncbi:3-dehydroquinate synthase [Desulfosoma sp.]
MTDSVSDFRRWKDKPRIGIIGGQGAMGRLFHRFFEAHGFPVAVSDVATALTNEDIIDRSDVVLVSVPLHKAFAILESLAPRFRSGQLVADICSLKVPPLKAMEGSAAWYVGLHPMYGPYVKDFVGQTMIVCPGRVADAPREWLMDLLRRAGLKIHVCSAEEHDRMMTVIQLIPHVTTVVLGHCLRDLGIDAAESQRYTSPIYRLELDLIGRLFAQDPALYAAIAMENPYKNEALGVLRRVFFETAEAVEHGRWDEFLTAFEKTRSHFGNFCLQALEETNRLLTWHHNANNHGQYLSNAGCENSRGAAAHRGDGAPHARARSGHADESLSGTVEAGGVAARPSGAVSFEGAGVPLHEASSCGAPNPFPVTVEPHGARSLASWVQKHVPDRRPYVFVDRTVASLWGDTLNRRELFDAWIEWDAREDKKRLATVEELARGALQRGADRGSVFVAVGGGITGDVIGFLASIFMRGVPVVQVPTTLLAQVDSCLGGKTGVDLAEGKNLIGTFHHPQAVLVDPAFLETLPDTEWQNGMAEVIKYALLDDGGLMETLEAHADACGPKGVSYPLPLSLTRHLVSHSLALKARYVAADEKDFGLRQLLNLGHTTGHGLEALSGYALPHGHAVALGMRVAVRLGILLGLTDADLAARLDRLLRAYHLPLTTPLSDDAEALLRHIRHDKKKGASGLVWIVPRQIGRVERRSAVPEPIIRQAFQVLHEEAHG